MEVSSVNSASAVGLEVQKKAQDVQTQQVASQKTGIGS